MDVSPQSIRSTTFKSARKGYDPDEVNAFRERVAAAVELAQNQAASMEARARAAVAKLQELSQQNEQAAARVQEPAPIVASTDDAETISRALLLAQRTADSTVENARAEASRLRAEAESEASSIVAMARASTAALIEEGRAEARRSSEAERAEAANELQSLMARRDFLLADVDQLEQYVQAQRERLRDAAVALSDLVDRVPGGLGEMRRPLMSASADPAPHHPEPTPLSDPSASSPNDDRDADGLEPTMMMERIDVSPAPSSGFSAASDATPAEPPPAARLDADDVWRMVDQDPPTRMPALSFDEVTGEVPEIGNSQSGFRINGDDLR
jgi:DivIVA domain-containing protein